MHRVSQVCCQCWSAPCKAPRSIAEYIPRFDSSLCTHIHWDFLLTAPHGNKLAASRRQRGYEDASSNRKSVFQNCNSQIRQVTAEPLAHVITSKGSRNRSQSAEHRPLRKRSFHDTINCRPADRTRHDTGRKRRGIQSAGCKGQLVCNQFAHRKISDSFRRRCRNNCGEWRTSETNQSAFCSPSKDRGRSQGAQARHCAYPDC